MEYDTHSWVSCIDSFHPPSDVENWKCCPICNLTPLTWTFDNGRSTACGCWNSKYDHFAIHAESINSIQSRLGNTSKYDFNELKNNWNQWCVTQQIVFEHASNRSDGRW